MRWLIALAIVAACGTHEKPSPLDEERARAKKLCDEGNGHGCFIAAAAGDNTQLETLRANMELWTRGCELRDGASCAQLGTVAEFGMESGGAKPDKVKAVRYYALACELGEASECKRAGMHEPETKSDWHDVLAAICGTFPGEPGPLFADIILGQPMPASVQAKFTAFEKKFKAHVRYSPGDPQVAWSLSVTFDKGDGFLPAVTKLWDKPDYVEAHAWTNATAHVVAHYYDDTHTRGLIWAPYRSANELIAPDDKTKLGFEPLPVVGAKIADVQAALGTRLQRLSADEYFWIDPKLEVDITVKHGIVTELRTVNWFTASSSADDAIYAALAAKWGKPRVGKDGTQTWTVAGHTVRARKP